MSETCEYGRDSKVFYIDSEGKRQQYECPHKAEVDGFCMFHKEGYWKKNEEIEQKVREAFLDELRNTLLGEELLCIGYHLPDIDVGTEIQELLGTANFSRAIFQAINFAGVTFHGIVRFDEATFQREALFDGATFEKGVTFEKLGGFSFATFKGETLFDGATFEGEARFGGATFQRRVSFDRAIFREVWFDEVTFQREAWFEGVTFQDEARFVQATFKGETLFDGATFEGEARFGGATFQRRVSFDRATFQREAWFRDITGGATFEGEAWFRTSKFKDEAVFSDSTFRGRAVFEDSTFGGRAVFDGATFVGEARFNRAIFESDAGFIQTNFQDVSGFNRAKFGGNVVFHRTTFRIEAGFVEATFKKMTYFMYTRFKETASFRDTVFIKKGEEPTDDELDDFIVFRRVELDSPDKIIFENCSLKYVSFIHTDITRVRFRDCKWSKPMDWDADNRKRLSYSGEIDAYRLIDDVLFERQMNKRDHDSQENKKDPVLTIGNVLAVYRMLRENYEYHVDYETAGKFFVGEMEARRRNTKSVPDKFILGLYRTLSLYGQSYIRPLIVFGILIVIFAFLRGLLGSLILCFQGAGINVVLDTIVDSVVVSLQFTGTEAIDVFQRVLSLIMLVLFGLALKRRFERRFRH